MHRSGCTLLCPVRSWASIVRRVLSYPGTIIDNWVNTILVEKSPKTISSTTAQTKIRSAAGIVGEDVLGFSPSDIGKYSIRLGAAMHMYLAQVPTFSMMMIGRWSSEAFLRYIRKHVEQFSHKVSSRMIRNKSYFTMPNFQPKVSRHDTRTPNDPRNFATTNNGAVHAFCDPFVICV